MPPTPWDIAVVLAKAITYAATLGSAGAVYFLAYSHDLLMVAAARRIKRLALVLTLAAAFASCLRIVVLTGSMNGELAGMFDADLVAVLLSAGEGRATGLRLAGLLLASTAFFPKQRVGALALLGASMAALSFAAIGHAHAVAAAPLASVLLGIHVLCVAFWLGALAPLLCVIQGDDLRRTAAATRRFGNIAMGIVTLLIVSGATVLYVLIGSVASLVTSRYGQAVLVKLGVVICLLGMAAFNKMRLTPQLLTGNSVAVRSLRRSIQIEMLLGGLILLVTAAFTTLTGPSGPD